MKQTHLSAVEGENPLLKVVSGQHVCTPTTKQMQHQTKQPAGCHDGSVGNSDSLRA